MSIDLTELVARDEAEEAAYWAALLADDERKYRDEEAGDQSIVCSLLCPVKAGQQASLELMWECAWDASVNR